MLLLFHSDSEVNELISTEPAMNMICTPNIHFLFTNFSRTKNHEKRKNRTRECELYSMVLLSLQSGTSGLY